jgi:tRNA(Ile)-lysidine synthase TilS/MesJ
VKISDYELKVKQGIDVAFEYHGFKGSKNEKTLMLYSGGMDSVSLAWNLLEHTEQDVHIHAIHLHNRENRINAEAIAIKKTALNLCSKTKESLRLLRLLTLG